MDAKTFACSNDLIGRSRTYAYDCETRCPDQQRARQDCSDSWSDTRAGFYSYDAGDRHCGSDRNSYDAHGRTPMHIYVPHVHTYPPETACQSAAIPADLRGLFYYYGLRYYSPEVGRWSEYDPDRRTENMSQCELDYWTVITSQERYRDQNCARAPGGTP